MLGIIVLPVAEYEKVSVYQDEDEKEKKKNGSC